MIFIIRNASVVINYDNIPNESNGIDKNNTFQLVERLDLDGTIDTEDDLLPSRYECADYNLDNRIYGGDFAKLAEFPWYIFFYVPVKSEYCLIICSFFFLGIPFDS